MPQLVTVAVFLAAFFSMAIAASSVTQYTGFETTYYPFCWRNHIICSHFIAAFNRWFGKGGCRSWCNCKGFEVWNCVSVQPDKLCSYESWRCQCSGPRIAPEDRVC